MLHLLLAEDDPISRKVLGAMLKRLHFKIDYAENGQVAVDKWEKGGYDLILMDIQMPRLNGFQATSAIREKELELGGHIPIIALTANALKDDEHKCIAAGMDAYLPKPVDFKKGLQLINDLVKTSRVAAADQEP